MKWMRDNLGIIKSYSDIDVVAGSEKDSGGVTFVSAFTGLLGLLLFIVFVGVIVFSRLLLNRCRNIPLPNGTKMPNWVYFSTGVCIPLQGMVKKGGVRPGIPTGI